MTEVTSPVNAQPESVVVAPPKAKRKFKTAHFQPTVVTHVVLSSWNVRVSSSLWKRLKYAEPSVGTAVELLNVLADKLPKRWAIHRITKDGKLLVVKQRAEQTETSQS